MANASRPPPGADIVLGSDDQNGAPIAAATSNCESTFSRCILHLESTGEERTATELRRLEAKFLDWWAYLGVFARGNASLDHRLGRHTQQRDLVLLALDMLDMSLAQMHTNPDDSESDESSDGETDRRTIELGGVRKSVNELSRLAIHIRLSPTSSLDARVQAFGARKAAAIAPFEVLAMLAVNRLYPDSTDSIRRLLGKAMTDRYARLLYWKYHDRKLRLDRRREDHVPVRRDVLPQGQRPPVPPAAPHISRTPTKSEIPSPAKPEESRASFGTGLPSDTIPSNQNSRVVIPLHEGDIPIQRRAGASTVLGSKARFPEPPKLKDGESSLSCPLCRKIFPRASFKDAVWWRQHVNDDLAPFVCLVDVCAESCKYASRAEWKAHTSHHHGNFWSRSRIPGTRDHMPIKGDASGSGDIPSPGEPTDGCPLCCLPLTEPGNGPNQTTTTQKLPSQPSQEPSASDLGTKKAKKSVRFDAAASDPAPASEHMDQTPQSSADVAPFYTPRTSKDSLLDHIAEHMQFLALLTVRLAVKRVSIKSDDRSFSSAQEASSDGTLRHRSTLDTDLEFSYGDSSSGDSPDETLSDLWDSNTKPKEDMMLLLERGDQSQITPELVEEIAASYDEDVMMLLLEKLGHRIQITTDVVKAVAGNQRSGRRIMVLLLEKRKYQILEVLHLAAENGHEAVAKLLVEAGVNKEARNRYGETPLHVAAENGHEAVARLLVEAGADKEPKNSWGNTPLHLAAKYGHEAVARLLVEAGADKEARNGYNNKTPLHLAAENGHEAVARLFKHVGAE
ncbi:hypothetical protein RB595_002193 [Gaeumannomyces hyphopodioides]